MLYTLLIYTDPAVAATRDLAAQHERWLALTQEMAEAGILRAGEALETTAAATTVRERNGEVLNTDGPFAETKEILGGFYLLDVPDLDAALAWAARMPNVDYGSIEVRPVMPFR